MNKCHTPLNFHNDTTPALNDTNMNYMDGCIETIDDRVVAMDTTKANVSDLETALEDWDVDNSTGDVTLTFKNGQTEIKHTNLSKIALNAHVIHDPEDPHYQQMEITYPDGTKDYIDFSSFVTNIELVDSPEIHFTHNDDGTTSASIINGSITANKLQPNFLADCQSAANTASTAATSANASRLESEGWAVGKQDGVDVPSTSPYYHNNAKYYAEYAGGQSLSGLSDVALSSVNNADALIYDSTLQKWVNGNVVSHIKSNVNVLTSAWETYAGSEDYGYKADISISGIDSTFFADVVFSLEDAISGLFAPIASTGTNIVTIYATDIPEDTITIPTIKLVKGVAI